MTAGAICWAAWPLSSQRLCCRAIESLWWDANSWTFPETFTGKPSCLETEVDCLQCFLCLTWLLIFILTYIIWDNNEMKNTYDQAISAIIFLFCSFCRTNFFNGLIFSLAGISWSFCLSWGKDVMSIQPVVLSTSGHHQGYSGRQWEVLLFVLRLRVYLTGEQMKKTHKWNSSRDIQLFCCLFNGGQIARF